MATSKTRTAELPIPPLTKDHVVKKKCPPAPDRSTRWNSDSLWLFMTQSTIRHPANMVSVDALRAAFKNWGEKNEPWTDRDELDFKDSDFKTLGIPLVWISSDLCEEQVCMGIALT